MPQVDEYMQALDLLTNEVDEINDDVRAPMNHESCMRPVTPCTVWA
jgi:hypothetical protein